MHVPTGQLEVGQLLIKAMYQKQPQLKDVPEQQLLQLLLLADRYTVPKVIPAVAAAINAIPVEQLDWGTAVAIFKLPDSCLQQQSSKDVQIVASEKLQQQLDDLELARADQQLTEQLLALPAAALKQLLQDDRTRVASENTVAYTVLQWYSRRKNKLTARAAAELGLLQLVRVQHCSHLYVSTVLYFSELHHACFRPSKVTIALACSDPDVYRSFQDSGCALIDKYAAWGLAKRPASARKQMLEWQLQLDKLKAAVSQVLSGEGTSTGLYSEKHVLQGQPLRLLVAVGQSDSSSASQDGVQHAAGSGVQMGVYLETPFLKSPAVRMISFKLKCGAAAAASPNHGMSEDHNLCVRGGRSVFSGPTHKLWGYHDLFGIGFSSSWDVAEAASRAKCLVHEDGCLRFQADIAYIN